MINEKTRSKIVNLYFNQGLSKSEIARKTDVCYRSVLKIIDESVAGTQCKPIRKPRKKISDIDIYENEVIKMLQDDKRNRRKQRHTAFQIFCELANKHDNFKMSYSSLVRLYNKVYPLVFSNRLTKVDMVESGTMYIGTYPIEFLFRSNNEKGCLLVCSFPYSAYAYYQIFRSDAQEGILAGIFNVFKFIGGIPPFQYYPDNTIFFEKENHSNALCRTRGIFTNFCIQNQFHRFFANDDLSRYRYHMQRKRTTFMCSLMQGNVALDNIASFNEHLLYESESLNNSYHFRKLKLKHELFLEEKETFGKIVNPNYEIYSYIQKRAGHQGDVAIDKNIYIMPPAYQDKYVACKLFYDRIDFENDKKEIIASYPKIFATFGHISVDWSKYLAPLSKKPGAYFNIDINKHFSKSLDAFLKTNNIAIRRIYFSYLNKVAEVSNFQNAIQFIEMMASKNITNKDVVEKEFVRFINGNKN